MSKFKEEEFIKKFKELNGDTYEYMGYKNGLVKFLCKKHNEINYDTPSHILSGRGCKICGKERQMRANTLANEKAKSEFIEKARKVHGDKYDYSNTNYIKSSIKVKIICPIHGEFEQTPNSHLGGQGCKKCGTEKSHLDKRKTTEQFIEEAKKVHGDKYDYSKVNYINHKHLVTIICPKHGEFQQRPIKHLAGHGCILCGTEKKSKMFSFTNESFIKRAKEIHGDKYGYSKVEYKGYDNPVTITCPIHGDFEQTPDSHLQGCGCRRCARKLSKNENEIYEFVAEHIGKENVIKTDKTTLPSHHEIDILIPSLKLGIEYNGCRWHSEKFGKDKYYHLNKTNECNKKGISLVHIFEDEYIDRKDIVLSKLLNLLKCNNLPKIGARKCKISEISYAESKKFLDDNHIQGSQNATIYLGAKYNNELVGVMTFLKIKDGEWELNRFASSIKYICQGLGSKLFNFFVKNYSPTMIKSFADKRWTLNINDNLYTKLGFKLVKTLDPDYRYVLDGDYRRIHKFNFRKQLLHKKYGFDLSMTENEMAEKLNAYKIWDCGLLKYVWKN